MPEIVNSGRITRSLSTSIQNKTMDATIATATPAADIMPAFDIQSITLPPARQLIGFLRSNASAASVIEKVNELDHRLREQEGFTLRIAGLFDAVEKRFKASETTAAKSVTAIDSILSRLETAEKNITKQRDDFTANDDLYDELEAKVNDTYDKVATLVKKVDYSETEARRKVLVIDGVPENTDKPLREILDDLLTDLQVGFTANTADAVFRRGKKPKSKKARPRPIIVNFGSQQYKSKLFLNVRYMKDYPQWSGVYLSDDLAPEDRLKQRDLKAVNALARARGLKSSRQKSGADH